MKTVYSLKYLEKFGPPSLLQNVSEKGDWSIKREIILKKWLECIGDLPPLVEAQMEIKTWETYDDYYLVNICYSTVMDDWVPANLLIPRLESDRELKTESDILLLLNSDTANASKSFPAVLALHPTSDNGKEDVSTLLGRENRKYGLELVKRGYVVLAPDTITAGDRVSKSEQPFQTASFYNNHPDWSAVAKMIVDHQQGINLLDSIKKVNSSKIGAIGHSLGGYNSYFLAAVDNRIKAVVCSCGFSLFAQDPELHRWGRREWFTHIPKISDYINEGIVPFEFNEIAALVAPTPFFIWVGQNDTIFPHWKPAAEGVSQLNSLYEWLGNGEKFTSLIGNSAHDFPYYVRQLAYTFLDRWL